MTLGRRIILTLLKISDLSMVVLSLLISIAATGGARDLSGSLDILEVRVSIRNLLFTAVYLGFWHGVLRSRGLYQSYRLSAAARELRDLSLAVITGVLPLVPAAVLFHFQFATVDFLFFFSGATLIALILERRALRSLGRRLRHYGRNLRNVIVVGTGSQALDLASRLARREDLGYHVVDVIEAEPGAADNGAGAAKAIRQVELLIERQPIDEVFLALPLDSSQLMTRDLIGLCEEQGITIRLMAHVTSLQWARAVVDAVEGQPVLTIHSGPPESFGLVAKRAIDIVGATLALVLLAPLLLIVAILVKLDSKGPIFFAQERVGFNRRRFRAFKFRTMVTDAEQLQASLESLNEADGPVFKIENDPRVTRLGRWLRRLSIDEIPQLLNVLKGEMSLVGPRPLPVRDVSRIDVRWHKRRFSVKPGITCLWQVNSRRPKFDEWIQADMEYIDNWSLALDLRILVKTIPAVLSGQGAH
ncbi:MAG TPA: sugar transferase [Candidatus Binatia bacterium]|nr:sugar transferase [Candidatus Binatia bacterium]